MKIKKIVHFSIGPVLAAILGFITLPFVAWFFSVEDVGRLSLLQVLLMLSITLFSLAMHQAYVREFNEIEDKAILLKTMVFPGLVVLIFCSILIVVFSQAISVFLFDIVSTQITFLLLVSIWATFAINFLAHVLRMQERALAFSATQVMPRVVLLILITMIVIFNYKQEFQTLIWLNTVAVLSSVVLFLWLTRFSWISAINSTADYQLMKHSLKFSLPLVIGGLAYWGLVAIDRFFLKELAGLKELGIYSMAASLAAGATLLTVIFSNIWHPIVYKWAKEGKAYHRVEPVIEILLILVTFIWSIAGLFSWVLLYFLPDEYNSVSYLFVACISAPLFYLISEATVVGIGISRKTVFSMLASILAFIINGVLNYLMIPVWGAGGAAVSTVIAFFVFFIVRTEASRYLWHSFPRFKLYLILFFYVVFTVSVVILKSKAEYLYFGWILLFLFVMLLFYKRVYLSLIYLRTRLKGG